MLVKKELNQNEVVDLDASPKGGKAKPPTSAPMSWGGHPLSGQPPVGALSGHALSGKRQPPVDENSGPAQVDAHAESPAVTATLAESAAQHVAKKQRVGECSGPASASASIQAGSSLRHAEGGAALAPDTLLDAGSPPGTALPDPALPGAGAPSPPSAPNALSALERAPSPLSGFEVFKQIFGMDPGDHGDWDFQLMTTEMSDKCNNFKPFVGSVVGGTPDEADELIDGLRDGADHGVSTAGSPVSNLFWTEMRKKVAMANEYRAITGTEDASKRSLQAEYRRSWAARRFKEESSKREKRTISRESEGWSAKYKSVSWMIREEGADIAAAVAVMNYIGCAAMFQQKGIKLSRDGWNGPSSRTSSKATWRSCSPRFPRRLR